MVGEGGVVVAERGLPAVIKYYQTLIDILLNAEFLLCNLSGHCVEKWR